MFYALSMVLPINHHTKITDLFALFGYLMIFLNNKHFFGYVLVLTYYAFYLHRHYEMKNTHEMFQIIGAISLMYLYLTETYILYNESCKDHKHM